VIITVNNFKTVHLLGENNKDERYNQIAQEIIPVIASKEQRALIYVDFINDTAPLAICLRKAGYNTCSYHGQKMSANDKLEALDNWRKGTVLWCVQLLLVWASINLMLRL